MDVENFGILNKKEAREELGLPDKTTLLFLGRPVHYKGLKTLLESLNLMDRDLQLILLSESITYENGRLFYKPCISSRPYTKEISTGFKSDNIFVRKVTNRNEVSKFHSSADVLVCPSLYESVGYVNLEAMSTGLPIVASNTGGIPEFVIDKKTGLLFEPGNPADLAEKIENLLNDPALSKEISSQQKIFISEYDIRNNQSIIDEIYRGLK
ncbi:MAG: glycosyltransferase family 4 protein [Candidatus Pacearchaeota archaeon]|jgi:starch synthase